MADRSYQICTRCVMDTTDQAIEFNDKGVCNHCIHYEEIARKKVITGKSAEEKLGKIVAEIKEKGKNQEYDSIMGLSGGVDSSYLAYYAKKLGLRPLVAHLDNGWNSELAVKNIENIVKKLGIDLFTYVIDWKEFKDLQVSFFKANVVDIEMLTDHSIKAAMYQLADQKGIKYILSGSNHVSEAIMPNAWGHRKSDLRNIKGIHRLYGTKKLKSFPMASEFKIFFWYNWFKNIKFVSILNYIPYNKKDAIAFLEKEFEWKNYGGKHYESLFTRFYQAYILPVKFNIDKRKAHLSTLICSGQITREKALEELKEELYNPIMLAEDKKFVLKKLGLSEDYFAEYLRTPGKHHLEYPSYQTLINFIRYFIKRV